MVTYIGYYFFKIYDIKNKKVSKLFTSKENAIKYCKENNIDNFFIKMVKV